MVSVPALRIALGEEEEKVFFPSIRVMGRMTVITELDIEAVGKVLPTVAMFELAAT